MQGTQTKTRESSAKKTGSSFAVTRCNIIWPDTKMANQMYPTPLVDFVM